MRRYEPEDFFGFSIGLPCEPGRGLRQDLAIKLHLAQLTGEASPAPPARRCQNIAALAALITTHYRY